MALQVYTLEQHEEWDNIVRLFEKFDTYWLSGYVKAFKIHGDGEPLLFYYEGKGNDEGIRGINAVIKRDIQNDQRFADKVEKNTLFDFVTPYGYGGWLIENRLEKDTAQLFIDYERWCIKNNIVSEFVRFHPVVKNHLDCKNAYDVIELGKVITMDLTSPEIIWKNIVSKNRNVIRKAIKNDVVVYNGRYPEIFETFRTIYNKTMDKDEADKYYYFEPEFYESIMNDLSENAQVFYAVKDDVVIAAAIMLGSNGMIDYHLSGSLREYSSMAATNLILYKTALWGSANGYKSLYLGGGVGSGEDSLFKFKRAFYKGDLNHFNIGKKIFIQEKYDELVNMREETDGSFFPKYRA